ncbi:oligosaccharide repeat unit polymerase [Yoonia tamlensis]|uniref:Oligosaccharide repeat unit polymerase n=1 Tax=Yoonia tamlensis TaxID=390270 RepID=A0A1I6GRA0_9RHOB|nr:oligosaccharide repeat unit polymerase [Yoonia tamlensis]SFR44577.1 oligosaccharide repeat unit polymerase [Yoonia tamlensis]
MEIFLVTTLALLCTVLPFVIGQRLGCVRYVSPMHLLGYFCGFGFLAKVAAYGFSPSLAFYGRFVQTPSALAYGALYLGLFVLLICCGYVASLRISGSYVATAPARQVAAHIGRLGWLFGCAFLFSLLTFATVLRARGLSLFDPALLAGLNATKQINVNDAGVGATLAGIKTFFVVPKFAFVLLLANGIARRAPLVLAGAGALGALLVGIAVISGDRFELIELMLFALATYAILGGRIGARALCVGLLAAGMVLAVSAYMTQLRFHGAHVSLFEQIVGATYFLDINVAVMVTDRVAFDQQLLGQSYAWWSFGWVPRAFWPDKPAIDLGVYFKRDIMQIYTGGAFNVTGPGEAFINFGWFGLGVAPLLGALYRRCEEWLLNDAHSARFLLYPILFYPFVQATLQSSFSAFIVGAAAQMVLVVAMIALFVTRFRRVLTPKGALSHAV